MADVLPDPAVRAWFGDGVALVGGCCGLGVEHIRAASRAREGEKLAATIVDRVTAMRGIVARVAPSAPPLLQPAPVPAPVARVEEDHTEVVPPIPAAVLPERSPAPAAAPAPGAAPAAQAPSVARIAAENNLDVSAVAGSLGTRPTSEWYQSLDKPAWQPPGAAFPLVWTPLYGLIAWGTGRAAEKAEETTEGGGRRVLALTAADLAVNAGWCWVFFARQSPGKGLVVIAGLDALNIALLREAAKHDKPAAAALRISVRSQW